MSRRYNDEFIREFESKDEDYYVKCLRTINYLDKLRNNYNSRYDSSYQVFDGTVNLFKESLDHYVLRRMTTDKDFINTLECNNYFSYLLKLAYSNDYDFSTNVVLHNLIYNSNFYNYRNKYLSDYISRYRDRISSNIVRIKNIFNKIKENKKITQEELDLVCGYVSDYRENSEKLENVVIYIFNNLTKEDSDLKCSPQVISAILTYIPYTCKAIKKNGFDPSCVRLFAANYHHNGTKYTGLGASHNDLRQIILNGNIAKDTNFKSIVSSSNPFSLMEYYKYKDYSFTLMLLTAYHEITHQYQNHMASSPVKNVFIDKDAYIAGLPKALCRVLKAEFKDYGRNHDNDDIEIHATEVAWGMCAEFYKDTLEEGDLRNTLVTRSNNNMNGTRARFSFAVKEDNNGNLFDAVQYTLNNCAMVMENPQKRAIYFKQYPCLQYIFTDDGKFKLDIFLIDNFGYTQIGAGLLEKAINEFGVDQRITKLVEQKNRNSSVINTISNNIYMAVNFSLKKLYMIEYYTRKDYNDTFKINRSFIDTVDSILNLQNNTIRNGKRILNQVLKVSGYDDLIDSIREKSRNYYKKIVENINNSKNLQDKGRKNHDRR